MYYNFFNAYCLFLYMNIIAILLCIKIQKIKNISESILKNTVNKKSDNNFTLNLDEQ